MGLVRDVIDEPRFVGAGQGCGVSVAAAGLV